MKSYLCMLLCLAMLLALAACGSNPEKNLSAAYDKYLSQFSSSGSNGTLTVAMSPDFAPMEFYDVAKSGDAAIVGFDVLLANYLAQELDMKLVIKPMSFDACQAAVQTGNADIGISGFSWTYERGQNYAISDFYVAGDNETEQSIICLKENEGKFTKAEDFIGSKIGYQGASLQQVLVEETFGDMDVDISLVYVDLGTAVEALKAKQVDFLAVAHGNGESIIANANGEIAFTGFDFVVDDMYKNNVCLINKDNTALLEKVNAALGKAMANDLYSGWYDACKVYAGVSTLDELGFDDNGNKITE
ncbi:MAG: transporter substrate-binding domain-containing protein [Oscillospiraceae bacterium]|nr:transporter substrate-binding domain-containing protein [Oscillospiraceae bacterium]